MSLAEQLEPDLDEDLDDEETLPIGNAWALHLLDDERATKLACDRAWNSYLRSSREHGFEAQRVRLELTDAQRLAFRSPVHPTLAAERKRARAEAERKLRAEAQAERLARAPRVPGPRRHKVTTEGIVAVLRLRGPLARATLQALTGATQATFHRAVHAAIEEGCVVRHKGVGRAHVYSLPGDIVECTALRNIKVGELVALGTDVKPPKPARVPPPPDSEPPPSGGEPMPAPVPEPIAAKRRLVARLPGVVATSVVRHARRAPPKPRESFAEALTTALAERRARRVARTERDPFVTTPTLKPGRDGLELRFRGFIVRVPDRELANRLHKLACAEAT